MGHQSDAIWDHRLGFQIAKDSNGIDQVLLRVPRGASARISLYGGQVVSWKNNRGEELLFTTRSRNKAMGKQAKTKGPNSINATNGGIPICFQQFGNSGCLEQHGFVSTQMWAVDHDPLPLKASNGYNGVVSVVDLVLKPSDDDNKFWPQRFEIRLRVSLAMNGSLSMISRVRNLNGKAFRFKFAYHTYLSVSDISEVRIEGLETLDYLDNLLSQQRLTEQGDAITFESEVDRVYLNSPNMIVVLDHERKRTIVMRKDGLPDVVVWNPWEKKAKLMADFGDEEYKEMVCVDGAAVETPVTLKLGEEWTGRLELSTIASSLCNDQF